MNWERIEPWQYVVDAVALEYSRKFEMVELDDLRQECKECGALATAPTPIDEEM